MEPTHLAHGNGESAKTQRLRRKQPQQRAAFMTVRPLVKALVSGTSSQADRILIVMTAAEIIDPAALAYRVTPADTEGNGK